MAYDNAQELAEVCASIAMEEMGAPYDPTNAGSSHTHAVITGKLIAQFRVIAQNWKEQYNGAFDEGYKAGSKAGMISGTLYPWTS